MRTTILRPSIPGVVGLLLLLAFAPLGQAQSDGYVTNSNLRGVIPFGTYQFGEIDNINLATGALNLHIPLVTRKGRGMDQGLVVVYSSKLWILRSSLCGTVYIDTETGRMPDDNCFVWEPTQELYNARVVSAVGGTLEWVEQNYTCTYVNGLGYPDSFNVLVQSNFVFHMPDGATFQFPNRRVVKDLPSFSLSNCVAPLAGGKNSIPPSNEAQLSIGYSDSNTMLLDTSGNPFAVRFADGRVALSVTNTLYPGTYAFEDRNGNVIDGNGDTLKRTALKDSNAQDVAYTTAGQWITVTTQFPTAGGCVYQYSGSLYVTNSLTLPNGRAFTFSYDPVFGELTQVNLPTGGYIKYVYQTFPQLDDTPQSTNNSCPLSGLDSRRVVERRVSADGVNEQVWRYNYARDPATEITTTTVTDPLGNVTLHDYWRIYEIQSEIRNSSGTALRRTVNTWDHDGGPVQFNQDGSSLSGVKNRRIVSTTTTLLDSNQISRTETDYDRSNIYSAPPPFYNVTESRMNVLETREYDYGNGAPGALLRKTTFDYLHLANANYLNRHIWDRVTSKRVYAGAGNLKAQTTYGYDTTAITATSAVVQHDYANYGSGMTYRGNLTETSVWRNEHVPGLVESGGSRGVAS